MKFQKVISGLALPSIVIAAAVFAGSCRPMVTPEQLQELKDLRAKEKSVTEQIEVKKADVAKIKNEISARETELNKCTEESNFVKDKLASWPNVWPDWSPAPPPPVEPVPPTAPLKKKK